MSTGLFAILFLAVAAILTGAMFAAWRVQQRTGNSGWIDTTWSFAVGGASLAGALPALFYSGGDWVRPAIVCALAALWSARLGAHIAVRTSGIKDDPRYEKMQAEWGDDARRQMFRMCMIQAAVGTPLALSVVLAAWNPAPGLTVLDVIALAVLAIAIGGEALADRQLQQFKQDPSNKGKVCKTGLWRWSRHPNYFFEWLGWIAYPLFAINLSGAYAWGWLAIAGPVLMYVLLTRISGIPPLEDHMVAKHGDNFRAYQKSTSAFFPLPPAA